MNPRGFVRRRRTGPRCSKVRAALMALGKDPPDYARRERDASGSYDSLEQEVAQRLRLEES